MLDELTVREMIGRRWTEGILKGLPAGGRGEMHTLERWVVLAVVGELMGWEPLTLVSGYRSAQDQATLRARWEAGDRAGIAAPPAMNSRHTQGLAFDVARNGDLDKYGELWCLLDSRHRWGARWRVADALHFDWGGPRPQGGTS